ncbi:RNA-binding protein squid-like isoform X1 [Vespula maculifrons]|uniref:RNA-binding protein squid-like isoform X1 n=1 Tax=Vespula maculifrons TaxID=7453 RepID=A0ABD2CKI7_VESMC
MLIKATRAWNCGKQKLGKGAGSHVDFDWSLRDACRQSQPMSVLFPTRLYTEADSSQGHAATSAARLSSVSEFLTLIETSGTHVNQSRITMADQENNDFSEDIADQNFEQNGEAENGGGGDAAENNQESQEDR